MSEETKCWHGVAVRIEREDGVFYRCERCEEEIPEKEAEAWWRERIEPDFERTQGVRVS